MLYVLLFIFGMSIILGRVYCGWLCPLGLIMDLEILLRKALKIRHHLIPDKLNIALHKGRYLIALIFLLIPIGFWIATPDPLLASTLMLEKLAGHFRIYNVLIDPLIPMVVPWSNTATVDLAGVNFSFPYVQNIITFTAEGIGQILAVAIVIVILIGGFFVRRVWCRFCPTGASIAALNQFKGFKALPLLYVDKDEKKCTKCGVCKRVCSVQVNEVYEQKAGKIGTSQCMLCVRCVEMCPYEDALKLKLGNKTVFHSRNWLEQPRPE
jgi:polyferredoxin